jgi:hypothetical protein
MMKQIILVFLMCFMLAVLVPGCLETKEASPAYVNQATLNSLSWTMSGEPQVESMSQMIGDVEIVMNTATVNYIDEALMTDIDRQISNLGGTKDPGDGEEGFSSLFMTIRVALPAGITLPEQVLTGIIDASIKNMEQESDIKEFYPVGEETVTINTGSTVQARSYEGYIESDDDENIRFKIRGVIASWADEGTTLIVLGVIPAEDMIVKVSTDVRSSGTLTIAINEEREYQDILALIQNVE